MQETDYDPLEAFTTAVGGGVRDPYPEFARRRREEPVMRGGLLPTENLPEGFPLRETYTVFRFEDCARVLRDPETFSSAGYDSTIGMVMGHTILAMDPPEHRPHRNLVAEAFRARSLARWESELITPLCHELIDRFAPNGRADLVADLTFEFPVQVIARILGLPQEDYHQFQKWSIELIGIEANIERGLAASQSLRDYFAGIVAERRRRPADDLISDLVRAEVDGERLTDEAIYSFLRLLLPAGAETTSRSSSNLLFLLLTHPDQYEAVRRDRSLVPQAIEEGLRFEPPLLTINRTATRDVEIAGVGIPAGADVAPCLGSANHDETRWQDPERFDIFRPSLPHLAFAFGPHMCLGMHLARLETKVVLNAVMDRLENLRLEPDGADPHIRGVVFRSPNCLPVSFDPA
ncbi:MAG TPA: cytochrome P450 [Acidimicrobiales bacterium]|jgi:cytochrome P450|nr:cytochrome P450 [Acidimicrobiales bacterium]